MECGVTADYLGLLILFVCAVLLIGAALCVARWAAPRPGRPQKLETSESDESPASSPRRRHAVRYYVVAILFILFNAAVPFFYPWAAVFRELGWPGFVAMVFFTLPLLVGLIYEWRKGALDW
jgi:NADH-quinone oxidoreductase subunit A